MSPYLILTCIIVYFGVLLLIARITSRNATNQSYFLGNKASPWWAVAFGMVGDSLSGVTFISLPGTVYYDSFGYIQLVLGYLLGYWVIAYVLLPLYYRLNLTSIYTYLETRFGPGSQKTGSFYFLISRLIGAALRLYLAAGVLQLFVFGPFGVPFPVSVAIIITLILIYTYKGGIKTLVWTDTFQSSLLLAGVLLSIVAILQKMDLGIAEAVQRIAASPMSRIFFTEQLNSGTHFIWQFLSGAFIAIVMTGLDQNMMQKNLSMRTLPEAQKNISSFSVVLVFVNLFFVCLGALLYLYVSDSGIGIPVNAENGRVLTDRIFPMLALGHIGTFAAVVFILGLTAATFSSADSVLTTLTTSFNIDFMGFEREGKYSEQEKTRLRHITHIAFAVLLLISILLCEAVNRTSVLDAIFTVAAYTYGPLLGLFAFGLFTKRTVKDSWVPFLCFIPPLICYILKTNSVEWWGYKFKYELLLLNGSITFLLLLLIPGTVKRPVEIKVEHR